MKKFILKTVLVVGLWGGFSYIQDVISPMYMADVAVTQLEDSDVSYQQMQATQEVLDHFWILYLLPLLMYTTDVKKLIVKAKGEIK